MNRTQMERLFKLREQQLKNDDSIDLKNQKFANDLSMIGEIMDSSVEEQARNSKCSKLKLLNKMREGSSSPFTEKGNGRVIVSPKSLK